MKLTTGVNAGLAIDTADARIWVDALHDMPVHGYSTVTRERFDALLVHPGFAAPDAMLYTHDHPDHCSRTQTEEALRLWPGARVIAPVEVIPGKTLLSMEADGLRIGSEGRTRLRFVHLPHQRPHTDAENFGILIDDGVHRLFLSGDCAVGAEALPEAIEALDGADGLVLPFLWLVDLKGRRMVEERFSDKRIFVNHLPFESEDPYNYRRIAVNCCGSIPGVTLLDRLFQRETV